MTSESSRVYYNGEWQTTIRIPEDLIEKLELAFRLDMIKFNKLVCKALEHYAYCPVDSPRGTLEKLGAQVKELKGRLEKVERKTGMK